MFWFPLIAGLYCVFGQQSVQFAQQQPLLYYTTYVYSMLHVAYIFTPIWVFALVCVWYHFLISFPIMWLLLRQMNVREEARVRAMGASQELIDTFPIFKFKKATLQIPNPPLEPTDPFQIQIDHIPDESTKISAEPVEKMNSRPSTPKKDNVGSPLSEKSPKKSKKRFKFFKRDSTEEIIHGEPSRPLQSEFLEVDENHASCTICLEEYNDEDLLKQLPCMHHFHSTCIDDWLRVNAKCPYCVQNLKPEEKK